jgi:hypothetical protein
LCTIDSPSKSSLAVSSLAFNSKLPVVDVKKKQVELDALKEAGVKPRAFPKWSNAFPCFTPDKHWWHPRVLRTPAHKGLLFLKEMKTGSSTMAGITIRIARNMAKRLRRKFRLCKGRFDHTSAFRLDYGNRDPKRSFLFTVLREPSRRVTSQFFHFGVSREKSEPTDANFKYHILRHPYLQHYYLRDLSTSQYVPGKSDNVKAVNDILQEYDFIGITERMDESLVAMQMILGLETNDMLYLRAKGNGGYDDGAANNGTCHYIVPSFTSPGMKEFFKSETWLNMSWGDTLLYYAALHSLDLTIDKLGRDKFNRNLLLFRKAMALAESTCTNVRFPCSESGDLQNRTDCLWLDSGCGTHCLDNLPVVSL